MLAIGGKSSYRLLRPKRRRMRSSLNTIFRTQFAFRCISTRAILLHAMNRYVLVLLGVFLVLPLFAEQPSPSEQALARKDWGSAERLLRNTLSADPKDGGAWF